jgi:RNA polymerase-interacting CarD/CdnL/TRCF family regulator
VILSHTENFNTGEKHVQETTDYEIGDWIAHSYYGIGQIECVESKRISGEDAVYYRIKAKDSIFWVPIEQSDDETVRPLSSLEEIQQALEALAEPPNLMPSSHQLRKSRLLKAQRSNSPKSIAGAIRDLRSYKKQKKSMLNLTERKTLKTLKRRLAVEWALVAGIRPEKALSKLDNLLA